MSSFSIVDFKTEYQNNPIGLDVSRPHFAWKVKSQKNGYIQKKYKITVGSAKNESDMWDSGIVESEESVNILYAGKELEPMQEYFVSLMVRNEDDEVEEFNEATFEMGLLNPSIEAWSGAKWIGAPEKYVSTETIGVFVLTSKITLKPGSKRAGIVFGANDERLLDPRKNQYEIAGENYIRYEIDVTESPANLVIFRVGYHPDDSAEKPFVKVPIVGFETKEEIINDSNKYDEHELKIEVVGDCAFTYVDGVLVDAEMRAQFFGPMVEARQLNPLGPNDTTTFPRLCEVGFYVGPDDRAHFDGLKITNYRAPHGLIAVINEEGFEMWGASGEQMVLTNPSAHSIPMLRRDFFVGKNVKKARLYITSRGIYDCRINGEEITDTLLNPGVSQYDKHIMYQTYDITDKLCAGLNGIGVTLASGWWSDAQSFELRNYNYYGDTESFLAKISVTYEDGTIKEYVTDSDIWECYSEGPYVYSGLFNGEHIDGRRMRLFEAFSKAGFFVNGMEKAVEIENAVIDSYSTMPPGFGSGWPKVDHTETKIVGGVNSPVREVCRVTAKAVSEPRPGLFIYDLGQEMAGVPEIIFHEEEGTLITVRYGEMLYPNLPEYGNLHGLMLTENYRDAESIDKYIARGDVDGEVFRPRFTFHGYRYIEISGVGNPPKLEEVVSIQYSSVEKITGKIETSNELLNRFIENVKWSQLCNFISIPTDCPQRNERMGWAGDTHVFCKTATYQSDVRLFYYRYLEALMDLQEENGKLPNIAPIGGGFGGITYECAMIFMVWELYQQYNDKDVIREYYESMKKWMEYITKMDMPGEAFVGPLGDWLAPEETDNNLIWNAFYLRCAALLSNMAAVIGEDADAKKYKEYEEKTRTYWNEKYVDKETGKTLNVNGQINDTQCAYALPLAYDVFDENNKKKAYEHLARKTKEVGHTVSTGFFGTGVLNPMLSEGGYAEDAYKLITQTAFPSWLYPVTQGATTIWERWNSFTLENGFGGNNSMNSFNHYSLGSVLSWMYENMLGIKRDEEKPGYKHFYLKPEMSTLEYAKGGFETSYGRIESSWERTENGYRYTCTIPENTSATLELKDANGEIVVSKALGSGTYSFEPEGRG